MHVISNSGSCCSPETTPIGHLFDCDGAMSARTRHLVIRSSNRIMTPETALGASKFGPKGKPARPRWARLDDAS